MARGLAGRTAAAFVNSKLTPLIIVGSLILGAMALFFLPREEEPQIHVPLIDIIIQLPGSSSKEVEQRISTPVEQWINEIPGIDYVYSTSTNGQSIVTARFHVGADPHTSLVETQQVLLHHDGDLPVDSSQPVIKERSIDDIAVLTLTLHSSRYGAYTMGRIASRLADAIRTVPSVSIVKVIGARPREVQITLNNPALASYGLTPHSVLLALQHSNQETQAGTYSSSNTSIDVHAGQFFTNVSQLNDTVVGASHGQPVSLSEVAKVTEGPAEPTNYVFNAYGAHATKQQQAEGQQQAVTISVAKKAGSNATDVVNTVLAKVKSIQGSLVPSDIHISITRNYGQSAADRANELVFHMLIAVFSVTLLIALALGPRESMVVAVAIPVTLALTLVIFSLYGYTLNRITLFALIFSIGILVDDAIVVVENIVRHYRMKNTYRLAEEAAVHAVDEVGNPTILATFAVISSILPMAFVGGLMGPYMRPIPVGASAAMFISVAIAFTVTPWAAVRLLRKPAEHPPVSEQMHEAEHGHSHGNDALTRLYISIITPLLRSTPMRMLFFGIVIVMLLGSVSLLFTDNVVVKMLPFDNKNSFQVVLNMDRGTTLAQTAAASQAMESYLLGVKDVKSVQMYVGTHSPINFNGLVRQYYFREEPWQADLEVNLVGKNERTLQSHEIVNKIRPEIARIAAKWHIEVQVAEVPPGPPVLETLVAQIYGPTDKVRLETARIVKHVFATTRGVTDVGWYHDHEQQTYQYVVDQHKAALSGVDVSAVASTLKLAISGETAGLLHDPEARKAIPIRLHFSRAYRSIPENLNNIYVSGGSGQLVPLGELVKRVLVKSQGAIYHKNLLPVIYVTGDVTGHLASPVYAIIAMNHKLSKLQMPDGGHLNVLSIRPPNSTASPGMKWSGEWQITYEVFRDLGIAFAAVLILIYVLVVGWFKSFVTPLVIMAPIPLTLVGILPAHMLLGAFFTATSMIGFIAGAGIIVRNSIILVDFIEMRLREGMDLETAVINAGAVRFRPMLLTAAAVIVGSSVILTDPIFQGLAISLMAGEIASTLLSRFAVPVLFFMMRSSELKRKVHVHSHAMDETVNVASN